LADAVDRLHLAAGHAVWPTPAIRDFDGWLLERYTERQQRDASLPRALTDFEERELWRAAILATEIGRECLEPDGAAASARRARRAMLEHGIPFRALTAYQTPEALALLEWNAAFEARCQELECIPADRLLTELAPDIGRVAWIDSPSWRPVARRWLQTHGGAPLAPARTGSAAVMRRHEASAPDAELAAIAHWAAGELAVQPNYRAWILIPDLRSRRTEVEDAFDAALAPQRFRFDGTRDPAPYAIAGGTALADYAPVRAALCSLRALTGPLAFEDLSALLRLPELHASPSEAAAAAQLDVMLRERGPSEAPLRTWLALARRLAHERVSAALPALARIERCAELVTALPGSQPLTYWASVWLQAFQAAAWAWPERWSSTEFQAAERFRDVVVGLAAAAALFGSRGAASALGLLQRAARDTAFQPQTGVPPIAVSGHIMDPWLDYDGLWIAGCDADRWPPPVAAIPLIPLPLQRQFGVVAATAALQFELAVDLERRWRRCADRCVFSCAPTDGRAVHLSPLLSESSPLELAAVTTRPHWQAFAKHAPRLERLNDEQAPPVGTDERTRGVATLQAQSRCAFRGFAQVRLACDSLDRPVPGFNQRERGTLLHRVLEEVWSTLRSSAQLAALAPAERTALIRRSVVGAVDAQAAQRDPGREWQRRERGRLEALIDKWLQVESLREPFEVEAVEQGMQIGHFGGLEFHVRIDRCDRLVQGGRVLIDYKSGNVGADWRGERPDNPQLPIYALLQRQELVAVAYAKVNAGECGFVAETARNGVFKPGGRRSALEGQPDFAALVDLWAARIETLAAQFAAGNAAVAPTLRACASCDLQALCRIPSAQSESADAETAGAATAGADE
jgi:probable DNA repair protein